MALSLPISLPIPVRRRRILTLPCKHSPFSFSVSTSIVCLSAQNRSGNDREEVRWLREEQRWLREEQRWLREEQRWLCERESLLREISDLKLRIETLESRGSSQGASVSETISSIAALLQVLKEKNRISESGSGATPLVLEEKTIERKEVEEEVVEKRVIAAEEIRVSEGVKKMKTLRVGSEGEEVREMQEALLKLGFYSGEEDMEFSSFSSGTERAVKTWQASLGVREDGIMTVDLLQRLLTDKVGSGGNIDKAEETTLQQEIKEAGNGMAVSSVTQISEMLQTVIKDENTEEVEVSQHRVFLLGENRWEEPSRLVGKSKQDNKSKPADSKTKCLTCRGEGRLMCTECDGTGEPNVEPQFLEWVDEGSKCPYCEGLGYTVCDVCEGETTV